MTVLGNDRLRPTQVQTPFVAQFVWFQLSKKIWCEDFFVDHLILLRGNFYQHLCPINIIPIPSRIFENQVNFCR